MIQDNILRFDYNDGNGKLVINLLNFFPSGKGRVRKLMQILALSDEALAQRFAKYREAQSAKVAEKDARICAEYSCL